MEAAAALSAVKARLDKSDVTTFDTLITSFITEAMKRFYPRLLREVDPQIVAATRVGSDFSIDLSTLTIPLTDFRLIEVGENYNFWEPDSVYQQGNIVRVRGSLTTANQLKIYGLKPYDLANLPMQFHLPLYWYAMSEWYMYFASNKAKYNQYMENGGASMDDMMSMSDDLAERADMYLEEKALRYGRQ